MISGLDSAYPPSAAQVAAAKAVGRRFWAGYFAGPAILNGWSLSDFERVRAGGLGTFAYVSGWSVPSAMRQQSDAWGVPICLDVEGGIRGFGAWVQPWLTAAAPCGLYGNPPIHAGIHATFHVCAAYPGYEPAVTWPAYVSRPDTPCAWQWQGSHNEFGITVDSTWADDAFAAAYGPGGGTIGAEMLDPTDPIVTEIRTNLEKTLSFVNGAHLAGPSLDELLGAIKEQITALPASQGGLTQQQVTDAVTAALKTLTLKAQ